MAFRPKKIVSGAQTGADRAALDVARQLGLPHGGWVPLGRWAEDGPVEACYDLTETPSGQPEQRTHWNVRDSDATVVLSRGRLTGGSALTARIAQRLGKPVLTLNLRRMSRAEARERLADFLAEHQPAVLNVAGPRASNDPRIYAVVAELLLAVLGPTQAAPANPAP
ncbi:MAG TPA: putative molybdenum carrier protein [Gemmatales bacterium]|nr:putative molybdenum carrier protein [Gemmatales bacterium]HMP58173.1 putative molybdenum carrier protein [Gemmatales bacterium]